MSRDLILHHYATSPYSEKARKLLAHKQLPWVSVDVPMMMPKPELMPLTGGYRKTPVLQIGRDIYCDTKLIARVLDHLHPARPLVPEGQQASARMIDRWVDRHLFFPVVALFFTPQGLAAFGQALPPGTVETLVKDRMEMFAKGGSMTQPDALSAQIELPGVLASLEDQLATQPYLAGSAPTLIDYTVYQALWFAQNSPVVAPLLTPCPRLRDWITRIQAMGDGTLRVMSAQGALDVCRGAAQALDPLPGAPLTLPGIRLGQTVSIAADDYGVDAVQGELVIANVHELAVRRQDALAGTVVVHFPTQGFTLRAA
jgi:glutathione S-transferase